MTAGGFLACTLTAAGGVLHAACGRHSERDAASAASAAAPVQPYRASDLAEGDEPSATAGKAPDAEAQGADASTTGSSEDATIVSAVAAASIA